MNEPSQSLEVVPQPEPLQITGTPETGKAQTAAQAKIDAVAALTLSAYQKAATLEITPEESAKLQRDFPDEAFKKGAGGNEKLIYIEHAFLRDRFNEVFGLGRWAIIPRNRWGEDYTYEKTDYYTKVKTTEKATRIYVEAMLVVRGCFVGEAVGAMEYYPKNQSQNYGDAVEGAKTAAFRRCAKEFGVGLQAWKKDWCEGWWARKLHQKPPQTTQTTIIPPHPPAKSPAQVKQEPPKAATAVTRTAMIEFLLASDVTEQDILGYGIDKAVILPNEGLVDWPLDKVGTARHLWQELLAAIKRWRDGDLAAPVQVPRDAEVGEDAEWRSFPMPFGKKAGIKLHDLEKNYLFGLWANFKVETEYNGKAKKPETIAKDTKFREMLDMAGLHYEFSKPDDEGEVTP